MDDRSFLDLDHDQLNKRLLCPEDLETDQLDLFTQHVARGILKAQGNETPDQGVITMSTVLKAGDSINLTTGEVTTARDTVVRENLGRLAQNDLRALRYLIWHTNSFGSK